MCYKTKCFVTDAYSSLAKQLEEWFFLETKLNVLPRPVPHTILKLPLKQYICIFATGRPGILGVNRFQQKNKQ